MPSEDQNTKDLGRRWSHKAITASYELCTMVLTSMDVIHNDERTQFPRNN